LDFGAVPVRLGEGAIGCNMGEGGFLDVAPPGAPWAIFKSRRPRLRDRERRGLSGSTRTNLGLNGKIRQQHRKTFPTLSIFERLNSVITFERGALAERRAYSFESPSVPIGRVFTAAFFCERCFLPIRLRPVPEFTTSGRGFLWKMVFPSPTGLIW
jgi:hypothetical protein